MTKTKPTSKVAIKRVAAAKTAPEKVVAEEVSVLGQFLDFVRGQGVVGLATAVVLGGAVTKVVGALVTDLINPIVGVLLGTAGDLSSYSLKFGGVELLWGHFLATLIDFAIISAVIYFLVRGLKLDQLDKKK